MNKILAVAAVAVLTVGVGAATVPAQAQRQAAARYTPAPISWRTCDDPTLQEFGAQCGMLTVPLDYAKPNGTKIKLAVSRVLHKPGAKYQGVMLTNPGGPGGSGLILSVLQTFVPQRGGYGYDWIGFDPRGVGSSVPALACDASYTAAPRQPYRPSTARILNYWLNKSQRYADDCAKSPNAALFKHVRTIDTVADIDTLRKALGKSKINYYGFSYGTYLGQVYATVHPDKVRRFVFDGVVGPKDVWYRANLNQDVAFQKTFNIYLRWLAKYHAVYHVGNTFEQVRATFLRTQNKLDKNPVQGKLGGDELSDIFGDAAYYVFDWEDIASAYSAYITKGDASGLIALSAVDTSPGSDNDFALYLGTQCTDTQWPTNILKVLDDNRRYDRKYPFETWSNGWFNGPCNFWPFKASTPVKVSGKAVKVPILFNEETFDAATPFAGALQARKLFPSAVMIEGAGGSTHAGSLFGVACTDNTIAQYLLTGKVPARKSGNRSDKICPPNPQPDPTARSAKSLSSAKSAAVSRIRAALAAAQRWR